MDVTLVNTGNVAARRVGAGHVLPLRRSGLEHAAWAALASDPPKGKQRLDVLLDDLAESHGGLVTPKVENGAIPAGESRRCG